jgi:HEAT repeat protein
LIFRGSLIIVFVKSLSCPILIGPCNKSKQSQGRVHAMKRTLFSLLISLLIIHGQSGIQAAENKKSDTTSATVTRTVEKKTVTDKSGARDAKNSPDRAKTDKKQAEKEPQQSDEKKGEWIEQTLDFGIQEDRLSAVNKIQQIKDPGIRGRLVKKLLVVIKDEDDPELLKKSVTVLGEMKETSAIPLIMEKIDHRSEDVGIAAVYALKNMNGTAAKEKLIQKVKAQNLETNSNFTNALLQTLGEFKAVELVPYVREALGNPKTNNGIKEELILFLGKVQSLESKDILLKIYRDDEEEVALRAFAVNSLSRLGSKDVTADIKEIMKTIDSYDVKKRKKYYNLYLYSIAALAKLGDQEAIPKLINALRNNSSQVRLKAISLIKDFKDKRTIDILKYKMNYDQNPKVQSAARKALKEMGVDVGEDKKEVKKSAKKKEEKKQADTRKSK